MSLSYRGVKTICQNNSMQSLILTGYSTFKGAWTKNPVPGDIVAANGANSWSTSSNDLNSGCGGYLTFICSEGYVIVSWMLPWMGDLEYEVRCPESYRPDVRVFQEQPDAPVLQITLWGEREGSIEHTRIAGAESIRQIEANAAELDHQPARQRAARKTISTKKTD